MLISMLTNAEVKNKTLTIDFSKGNEWVDAFQYRTSPIRGKKYEVADGWYVKFSNGANLFTGETKNYMENGRDRFNSHVGPLFSRCKYMQAWIVFYPTYEVQENTGITLYNNDGKHATKITYYYDYVGLDPVLSASNEDKDNVGFTKKEQLLYTYKAYSNFYNKNMNKAKEYNVCCVMKEPVSSLNLSVGVQDPEKDKGGFDDDYEDEDVPVLGISYDNEWADGAHLYKIEIEYTESEYPSSYDGLLKAYKKLQANYEDSKASVNFLLQNVAQLTNNRDSLNNEIKRQQQEIEEYEAEHEEDLSTLANAQAVAYKYSSLYRLERAKIDDYTQAYPEGVPSLDMGPSGYDFYKIGLFKNTKFSCCYNDVKGDGSIKLNFGKDEELYLYANNITHKPLGVAYVEKDGSFFVGTKKGYRISRVELEYSSNLDLETEVTPASHNTIVNENTWKETKKKITYVANLDVAGFINIRGVNITPAEGIDQLRITNIRVWTELVTSKYDWAQNKDEFFDWDIYCKNFANDVKNVANIQIGPKTVDGVYNINGQLLTKPQSGINIVDRKKILFK